MIALITSAIINQYLQSMIIKIELIAIIFYDLYAEIISSKKGNRK